MRARTWHWPALCCKDDLHAQDTAVWYSNTHNAKAQHHSRVEYSRRQQMHSTC